MQAYQTNTKALPGTSYSEIERSARKLHNAIAARTKRNPYVRSAYFRKDKVFIKLFWEHLHQKAKRDRKRRLRYYAAAIEIIRNTKLEPVSKENPNKSGEILHRFAGITPDKELFFIQVKEVKRNGNKYLMSVFPPN